MFFTRIFRYLLAVALNEFLYVTPYNLRGSKVAIKGGYGTCLLNVILLVILTLHLMGPISKDATKGFVDMMVLLGVSLITFFLTQGLLIIGRRQYQNRTGQKLDWFEDEASGDRGYYG